MTSPQPTPQTHPSGTPAQIYEVDYDRGGGEKGPNWVVRAHHGAYVSYHYIEHSARTLCLCLNSLATTQRELAQAQSELKAAKEEVGRANRAADDATKGRWSEWELQRAAIIGELDSLRLFKVPQLEAENAELRQRAEAAERERDEARTSLDAWHSVFETTQLSHAVARLQNAELAKAQLAEAQKDGERLAAVNFHQWTVSFNDRADHFIVQKRDQVVGNIGRGRTVYEAIDDAMSAQKGERDVH